MKATRSRKDPTVAAQDRGLTLMGWVLDESSGDQAATGKDNQ